MFYEKTRYKLKEGEGYPLFVFLILKKDEQNQREEGRLTLMPPSPEIPNE
jgi:hypothetical protein